MSRFGTLARAAGCAALMATGASPALAQYGFPTAAAATPYPAGEARIPAGSPLDGYAPVGHRRSAPPAYYPPAANCPPGTPAPGTTPPGTTPPGMMPPTGPEPTPPAVPDLFGGADAGPTAGLGGYIDNALPMTQFRLRYDSAWGNNRPDRGEFFYAKCGCFRTPDAKGPPLPETNVDTQTLYAYAEYAVSQRFSVFTNVPVRFINPEQNKNSAGFSDLHFGFKYALVYNPTRVLTFQLQTIVPTGQEGLGLGTGNVWLEPGLLYQEQVTSRWQVFGQFKDQIPVDRQSDFTANILTYGIGSSYIVANGCWGYVAPVGEFVGWTLLSGRELDPGSLQSVSARGDTIVNAKFGVRIGFGESELGQIYPTRSDLYLGYGRALTGEVWYKNMFRLEYRLFF